MDWLKSFFIVLIIFVVVGLPIIFYVYYNYYLNTKKNIEKNDSSYCDENEQKKQPALTVEFDSASDSNAKNDYEKPSYSKIEGSPNDYIVLDLETTGLDYKNSDILEIGAIKYINGTEVDRFHTYIRTNKTIPQKITDINGISNETVKDAPLIRHALKDFMTFIYDYTLIAYNSDFDMSFLQYNYNRKLNTEIKNDVIDALPLARKYLSELPNKKLETVKNYFGLNVESHNAIGDCIVTNHLYQYCRQFEELKYRYVIPFSYAPTELNEKEVLYLEEIVKICEENGISRTKLTMSRNQQYLTIESNYWIIARLKLYSKLQYILLKIPYSEFNRRCNTDIKYTPAQQNESDYTRVFPESPEQLRQLKDYIPTRMVRFQITNNN